MDIHHGVYPWYLTVSRLRAIPQFWDNRRPIRGAEITLENRRKSRIREIRRGHRGR